MMFVISGPSGCGKSTLIRRAREKLPGVRFTVSHTTRPPRRGEVEGRDYYFISREKFERMRAADRFTEWAVVHGCYYGTSRKEIERKGDIILDLDVQGARQVRKKFREAVFIFILPPLYRELKTRLEERRDTNRAEIRKRLGRAAEEIADYRRFDYLVVNKDLDAAAADLEAIIRAERCRRFRREKEIRPILKSFKK